MDDFAIRAVDLSKSYRIRHLRARYDTLRDDLAQLPRRILGRGGSAEVETVWAVRDMSFEIGQGEVVGLVGRNGAGKTTLLRLLSRITVPTSGYADIRGRVGSLLEVGTGFHPELTGRENIFLNGAILGMRRAEIVRKFDEIVAFAGVEKFLDTPVKRYSSGMHVRLAFSVAAHLEPEIMLVDEVLAVGDAEFQKRVLGKLDDIGHSGRTVIFVSHNMQTITRLCERAILLNAGRVVRDGPADEVVGAYLREEYGSPAARRWQVEDAPGDEHVRLRGVRVVDASGEPAADIDVRNPVGIELQIEVEEGAPPIVPWLSLVDEQDRPVFDAMDTDAGWLAPREAGVYRSIAWIPENLLNEGVVFVTVLLLTLTSGGKSVRRARAERAVSFLVYDRGEGDTARGAYFGSWSTAVRPHLKWTTEYEQRAPVRDASLYARGGHE